MNCTACLFIAAALAAAAHRPLAAQDDFVARIREIEREARAGNSARALLVADSLSKLLPDHPTVVVSRTLALALAGRTDDAVAGIRRLFRWDPRYARFALAKPELAPLADRLADVDLDRAVARAAGPIARARVLATIEERDLVPEGTAWDPVSRSVLIGSLNKDKIVAILPDGTIRDRVLRGSHGLRSVVGIHVDTERRILWAASNARYDRQSDTTPSGLYGFDPVTGAFRSRYLLPGRRNFLNDLTTAPDGTVYLTDSNRGRVWMLRPGGHALEPYAAADPLRGPNGITISDDGRHLFVADWDQIKVIARESGASWRLALPDTINVAGIDGLAFADGGLVAHHAGNFWRVVWYRLDPAHREITGRHVFELGTPDSQGATTGEVAGDQYVFIGNSQLDRMNGGTLDSAAMDPIRIYRVPLARRPDGVVAVSLSARDSVALFDAATLERIATVAVGRNPHEIAAAPDGRRAYVANAGDTTITVIETRPSPRVASTWYLPDSIRTHDLAVSPDGRFVWGVAAERKLVVGLEAASGRVRRRFSISRPGGWMIESGGPGGALVIGNLEGGAVTLLDPASGRETTLEAKAGEIDAAPRPDGRQVWSTNLNDGRITVFENGRVIDRMEAGKGGSRVIFSRDGRRAYAVTGPDSTLVAFDPVTRRRLGRVTLPGDPKVIALSGDGRRGYITHPERNALTLVDLAALVVLKTVVVPGTPDGTAVLEPAA